AFALVTVLPSSSVYRFTILGTKWYPTRRSTARYPSAFCLYSRSCFSRSVSTAKYALARTTVIPWERTRSAIASYRIPQPPLRPKFSTSRKIPALSIYYSFLTFEYNVLGFQTETFRAQRSCVATGQEFGCNGQLASPPVT